MNPTHFLASRRLDTIAGQFTQQQTCNHQVTASCCSASSSTCSCSTNNNASILRSLRFSPLVSAALASGSPIVALESTIITHGMPWPQNMECALAVEEECTRNGATPATIAILHGVIHVGLDRSSLETLARAGHTAHKCSRRDLAHIVSQKQHGATTVSGTMFVASLVGIKVFVTGGIGGVHRGFNEMMDVSADLNELGRTPVTVVSAGVKSILDIPRTLEYLETQGVPVCTLGASEFPAFFTRSSGCASPLRLDSISDVAQMIAASHRLNMQNGMVLAVPIPKEHEAAAAPIESATTQALEEATQNNIQGRDITPFLLGRINELTGGASLKSNIQLVMNNVRVGAQVAVQVAKIMKREGGGKGDVTTVTPATAAVVVPAATPTTPPSSSSSSSSSSASSSSSSSTLPSYPPSLTTPLVIGGTNQDLLGRPAPGTQLLQGTSNPGTIFKCWGGVGRNVAEVMGRMESNPVLLTAVGKDEQGGHMIAHSKSCGILTSAILQSSSHATSTYMAVLDERGDLFTTIADMDVCGELNASHLPNNEVMQTCPLLILDGNISKSLIESACTLASSTSTPVFFEPTSIEKCVRIIRPLLEGKVTYISPSAAELLAMKHAVEEQVKLNTAGASASSSFPSATTITTPGTSLSVARDMYEHNHTTDEVNSQCRFILNAIASEATRKQLKVKPVHIILKRGANGVMIASLLPSAATLSKSAVSSSSSSSPRINIAHLPVFPLASIVNTSGAGDTLVGATCALLTSNNATRGDNIAAVKSAVEYGMRAAEMTLMSEYSVSPLLSQRALKQRQEEYKRATQHKK